MFAQDSQRGNRGRSSSWEEGWNSYGNNSRDFGHNGSREDFRNPGPGRSYAQEESRPKDTICQNFLQNKCTRGSNCSFQHPPLSGSKPRPLATTLNSKKLQNAWLNFCPDFQRGQCPYTDDCRLLHVSKQDETDYRTSGDISTEVVEQAMSKSMVMDWAYIGNQPHCKSYLQGSCNMKDCRLRHLNTDQYVVEVLQALREKFEMNVGNTFSSPPVASPQKPLNSRNNRNDPYGEPRAGSAHSDAQESNRNQYGGRRAPGQPVSNPESELYDGRRGATHSRDTYEPESKRMRSQEGIKLNSGRPAGDSYSTSDESFLEKLRRDNVELTSTNEIVKKSARTLEDENSELRRALKLALDLNSYARNLPEFRNQLRDLMLSLRNKGFNPDIPTTAPAWNTMHMKSGSSSRGDGILGSGYSYR